MSYYADVFFLIRALVLGAAALLVMALIAWIAHRRSRNPPVFTRLRPPYLYVATRRNDEERQSPQWFLVAIDFKSHPVLIDDRKVSYFDFSGNTREVCFHAEGREIIIDGAAKETQP